MNFSARVVVPGLAFVSMVAASAASGQTLLTTSPYTNISNMTDISAYKLSATAPLVQGHNYSTISQTGSDNSASADMTAAQPGASFASNMTSQTQLGSGNTSTVTAVGNSNMLMTNQIGSDNTATIGAGGDSNKLTANQLGNGNNATIQFVGNNNNYTTTQVGANLSYSIVQTANNQSVSVTQIGVGKK